MIELPHGNLAGSMLLSWCERVNLTDMDHPAAHPWLAKQGDVRPRHRLVCNLQHDRVMQHDAEVRKPRHRSMEHHECGQGEFSAGASICRFVKRMNGHSPSAAGSGAVMTGDTGMPQTNSVQAADA